MDLFEILDSKFDLLKQTRELSEMLFSERAFALHGSYCPFAQVFDELLLRSWKYSKGRMTLKNLIDDLGVDISFIFHFETTEKEIALFLQLAKNILYYTNQNIKDVSNYIANRSFFQDVNNKLEYILDNAGFTYVKHSKEDYFLIVQKNVNVAEIAQYLNDDIVWLLNEYTSPLLKNDIIKKRNILKLIANKCETLVQANLAKYNNGTLHEIFDSLSMIFNNFEIRHSNLDPQSTHYKPKLALYTNSQFEDIYDAAFDLILCALYIDTYSNNLVGRIKLHKNTIV